jgi:hypothetical protein
MIAKQAMMPYTIQRSAFRGFATRRMEYMMLILADLGTCDMEGERRRPEYTP